MKKILLVLLLIVASVYADELNFPDLNFAEKDCRDTLPPAIDTNEAKEIPQAVKSNGFTVGQKLNLKDKTLHYDIVKKEIYKNIYNPQSPYYKLTLNINPTSKTLAGFEISHNLKGEECLIEKEKFLNAVFKKYGGFYYNEIEYSQIPQSPKAYQCKYNQESYGSVTSGDTLIVYYCNNNTFNNHQTDKNYILMFSQKLIKNAVKEHTRIKKEQQQKAFDNMIN